MDLPFRYEVRKHWNYKRSVKKNMHDLGLTSNPNADIRPYPKRQEVTTVSVSSKGALNLRQNGNLTAVTALIPDLCN